MFVFVVKCLYVMNAINYIIKTVPLVTMTLSMKVCIRCKTKFMPYSRLNKVCDECKILIQIKRNKARKGKKFPHYWKKIYNVNK